MSDNHQILKLFTRKLANCRYKVPVNSVIQYMDKGQFGYNVQEGENTVVTNDSVFASSITSVITHIRAIFKEPHIFLKKEETIQNIAVASHINNETLRMNYKDSKLWKTKALDTSPEFVHTFVYEDDYAIYENRFICYLMDELIAIVTKKINEIKTTIETLNWKITNRKDVLGLPESMYLNYADEAEDGVPVILPATDCRVSVLDALIKNKKNLMLLTHTPIYKACKKADVFNILSLKTTNILLHDKHYNYCYDFYLNYIQRESEFTSDSNMFKNFAVVNMICALNKIGFVCEKDDAELMISNSAMVKFKEISFIKEPFQIVMAMGEKNDYTVTVKNLVSGSSIKHFVKVVHTACDEMADGTTTAGDIFDAYKKECGIDSHNAWLVTDADIEGEGVVRIQPTDVDVIDAFMTLIKKFTLLAEGALSVYTCMCPVCGSNLVTPDEKDYYCVDCETQYHLFYYATRDLIWVKRLPKIVEEEAETVEEPVVEEEIVEETVEVEEVAKIEEVDVEEIVVEPEVEEPAVEETAAEEVAPVSTDVIFANADAFSSHIKRHFYAKVSHLEVEKKEFYNELKNYILQYKKVSVRDSWNYETFSVSRVPKVRLAVRGKTLVAFFALDPKEYENTKYFPKDMGDTKKFAETPMMVKVQSARGLKFAKELVDITLADLEKNEAYEAVDYTIPYKSDKQLFEEGLIKIVGEVDLSDYVRVDPVKETPAVEETVEEVVETPVEETVAESVEEAPVEETTEATEEVATAVTEEEKEARLKRHFLAKISQMEESKKEYYSELKNHILQYKKVSARASWGYETFSNRRNPKVRLAVRGKTLVAFFALDPKEYENTKYFPKNMGDTKKFADTPMMVKVKSERGLKYAKELIDVVLADLIKDEAYVKGDYKIIYKTDKELFAEGLIKVNGDPTKVDFADDDNVKSTAKAPFVETATAEKVEEAVVEETVAEEVVETPVEETVVEEVAVETPVEETVVEEVAVETVVEETKVAEDKDGFLAKFAKVKKKRKAYYDDVRAYILANDGVQSFTSTDSESFTKENVVKARLLPNGKFVAICVALDAKDYKKQFKAVAETKAYADTPMMVTLKAPRDVQRIKELLDSLLKD